MQPPVRRRDLIWLVIVAVLLSYWWANRSGRLEKIAKTNEALGQLRQLIVQRTPEYPEVPERVFLDYPPEGYTWEGKPIIFGDSRLPDLPPFSAQPPNLLTAPLPLPYYSPYW